jgi:hypothetical protein
MGKSYRKHSIASESPAESERWFKVTASRKERRMARTAVREEDDPVLSRKDALTAADGLWRSKPKRFFGSGESDAKVLRK